jgi:hypothetical protein
VASTEDWFLGAHRTGGGVRSRPRPCSRV